jgi:Na+/melibiose symporter-like transporter
LGLIALIGQEKLMSGRLSALWNVLLCIPGVAAGFASGYISEHLPPSQTLYLLTALTTLIAVFAFWKPGSVYNHAYERPQAKAVDFIGNLKRLVSHRAIYPAILINFLWDFSPGLNTPLQFYLANELHASDAVYSYFNGVLSASYAPAFLLYGFVCKRMSLNKLLFWGTVVSIPNVIPLAFVHTTNLALACAAFIGLTSGVAVAAYSDLAIRSCPDGLQGTLMMLIAGVSALFLRGGDLFGSTIYTNNPAHGFLYCAIATTITTALILPSILLIPKPLIAMADGEPSH